MRVPQIQITQTHAKINIETTQAKISIDQENAQMEIKQNSGVLTIEKSDAQFYIDATKAWEGLGKWSAYKLGEVITERRQQMALDAIEEIAAKGDRLSAIYQHTNPIPQMAVESISKADEMFITGQPSYDNVDIFYEPSKIKMNWNRGGIEIKITPRPPQFHLTPGQMEMYVRQMTNK